MSNINNGLMTKIWGPHIWFAIHSIAFGYPVNPTTEQKEQYKIFLTYLGFVLPCLFCRESYQFFIKDGDTKLTDDVFENRTTVTNWAFKIHNRVNKKLGVDYGTTYEELCEKFEKFRAKCIVDVSNCSMPLELKAEAFKEADITQLYIIPLKIAKTFSDYAMKRNIDFSKLESYNDIIHNKRNTPSYEERNIQCKEIIKKMRYNALPSIENDGEFKGLPTTDELMLISMLCSSMSIRNLEDCMKILGIVINKKYKLIKSI